MPRRLPSGRTYGIASGRQRRLLLNAFGNSPPLKVLLTPGPHPAPKRHSAIRPCGCARKEHRREPMTRVLIVDDDPVQLRLTAEVASRAGFVPLTAHGGRQALEQLRRDPGIDAVVLDLVMPALDGMAVLEIMGRENLRAPVIIQTASSSLETVVSAMRHGAADFFV